MRYCLAVIKELFDPLESSFNGVFLGRESLATVLLCETILSLLPSMSTRDMPYSLLKEYGIAPLSQGVIAQNNRIVLSQCAVVLGGLLHVPRPLFHRIVEVPLHARKQVVGLMEFLDRVRVNNKRDMAEKAASVLVEQFMDEVVRSGQVCHRYIISL